MQKLTMPGSQKHIFSAKDKTELEELGYDIRVVGTIQASFEMLVQRNFPGFDLIALLRVVENKFTPTTSLKIWRKVIYYENINRLVIDYRNDFETEDEALLFVREFSVVRGLIEVLHAYCVLPKGSRGKGLIKPVFQESLRQYVNMGATKILVHAGLSTGGYAWAKHGFVAVDQKEVNVILKDAERQLSEEDFRIVKKIYEAYYSRHANGKSFPMDLWAALDFMKPVLSGSDWHGELDLKNEEQFHNFKQYVFR